MAEEDRSAMHEAMEQQTVTISKANVHATLKAETSVLAAANPKFGRFDLYQPIAQQINIDPALLTRFDLIFIMKDLPERGKDEAIAIHVLNERKNPFISKRAIEPELLKKFVAYSKQKIFPELTETAMDEIRKFYVELRNMPNASEDLVKPIPITARQLEALIRLSEAIARVRLSQKITREDAKKAIELLKFCLIQVGFDEDTKQIDIDRISTGVTASQKSKIIVVREAITRLESRLGKLIPMEEIVKELAEKMDIESIEEVVDKLALAGDVFKPKRGFIQRM
jgi:replicative DNA helicase Mcm